MNVLRKLFPQDIRALGELLGYAYGAIETFQDNRTTANARALRERIGDVLPFLLKFRPYLPHQKRILVDVVHHAEELNLTESELILAFDRTVDELHIRLQRERVAIENLAPWTDRLLEILEGRTQVPGVDNAGNSAPTPPTGSTKGTYTRYIASGTPASPGRAAAQAYMFDRDDPQPPSGPVVVIAPMTTTVIIEWMPNVVALATDLGGRVCHAAVVARELGLPCVVGCHDVTQHVKPGEPVLIDGDAGLVLGME